MTEIGVAFALMVGCVFLRGVNWRAAFYAVSTALILYGVAGIRGQARPAEWTDNYRGMVVGFQPHEPENIDLWLLPKGADHPIYLRFPWSDRKAAQLYKVYERGKAEHRNVMLGKPGAGSPSHRHGNKASDPHKRPNGQERATKGKGRLMFYNSNIRPLPPKENRK